VVHFQQARRDRRFTVAEKQQQQLLHLAWHGGSLADLADNIEPLATFIYVIESHIFLMNLLGAAFSRMQHCVPCFAVLPG
jgi:hypothetical protein